MKGLANYLVYLSFGVAIFFASYFWITRVIDPQ
ncbi:hypothetical protein V1288_003764 [Bradyrhizobium sp. AZCC 2176]